MKIVLFLTAVVLGLVACTSGVAPTTTLTLERSGTLTWNITGLDPGDRVTLQLEWYPEIQGAFVPIHIGTGEVVHEYEAENGTGQEDGLRLSQGYYALVPKAEGYRADPRGRVLWIPEEGVFWRYPRMDFVMFRPANPRDEELTEMGIPVAGMMGSIAGLPEGAQATVKIELLAEVPGEVYVIGPPLPTPAPGEIELRYPPDIMAVDNRGALDPLEIIADLEVGNGRWGLVDRRLDSHRYLVTFEAPGFEVEPTGYIVVVFGGKLPTLASGVDFTVILTPTKSGEESGVGSFFREQKTSPTTPDSSVATLLQNDILSYGLKI